MDGENNGKTKPNLKSYDLGGFPTPYFWFNIHSFGGFTWARGGWAIRKIQALPQWLARPPVNAGKRRSCGLATWRTPRCLRRKRKHQRETTGTRWVPEKPALKWSYNFYKWPYKWAVGFFYPEISRVIRPLKACCPLNPYKPNSRFNGSVENDPLSEEIVMFGDRYFPRNRLDCWKSMTSLYSSIGVG